MRRAARWDGAVPLFAEAKHGIAPPAAQVRDVVTYLRRHRPADAGPFEVVVGGLTPGDPARARNVVGPLADAGATWWDERQLQLTEDLDHLEPVLRRVDQGPPQL